MSLNIKREFNDENCLWNVEIIGEVDIYTSDEFKDSLNKILEEKMTDIKINCRNLDYIDSTGLGVLIGVLKKLKNNEKRIIISQPKTNISKLLKVTGLDKIFVME